MIVGKKLGIFLSSILLTSSIATTASARFLSVDPMTMIEADLDPRFFNRYGYSFNDPINLIDPDGEQPRSSLHHESFNDTPANNPLNNGRTLVTLRGIDTIGNNQNGNFSFGHAFIEMTHPGTGEQAIFRGGDTNGTSGGLVSALTGGVGGNDILAQVNSPADSPDTQRIADKGLGVATLGNTVVQQPFSTVKSNATSFANKVTGANISYNAYNQNSNSAAGTGFEVITGNDRPANPAGTYPGYNRDLCNGQVDC